MAQNVYVSLDLHDGTDFDSVVEAMNACGAAIQAHKTLWFLKIDGKSSDAYDRIKSALTPRDCFVMLDVIGAKAQNSMNSTEIRELWGQE